MYQHAIYICIICISWLKKLISGDKKLISAELKCVTWFTYFWIYFKVWLCLVSSLSNICDRLGRREPFCFTHLWAVLKRLILNNVKEVPFSILQPATEDDTNSLEQVTSRFEKVFPNMDCMNDAKKSPKVLDVFQTHCTSTTYFFKQLYWMITP